MKWSAATPSLVPPAVVTKMLRVLAACAGENAVISVEETTAKLAAATGPKATFVAPVKLVPLMVTLVPPLLDPDVGETLVTVGGSS